MVCFLFAVCARHLACYLLRDEAGRMRLGHETAGIFFRTTLRIMGIRVKIEGDLPTESVLFTPNHCSYMDILPMGAVCPTFFVSKEAVLHWPIIGSLFRISKSLTINRGNRRAVREVNENIGTRITEGNSVCVFLEGTTSSGEGLLPFHASLLESVVQNGAATVPVGIHWHSARPHVDIQEDVAYWRDEHLIGPHAFRVLGLRGIEVTLIFGDPLRVQPNQDRKAFANQLRTQVLTMLDLKD